MFLIFLNLITNEIFFLGAYLNIKVRIVPRTSPVLVFAGVVCFLRLGYLLHLALYSAPISAI